MVLILWSKNSRIMVWVINKLSTSLNKINIRILAYYMSIIIKYDKTKDMIKWSSSKFIERLEEQHDLCDKIKTAKIFRIENVLALKKKLTSSDKKRKYTLKVNFIIHITLKNKIDIGFAISTVI